MDILKPFVVVSSLTILLFISLHSWSNFARADEYSNNIKSNAQYLNPSKDLFFAYRGQFVYFSELLPLEERAVGIRVFSVQKDKLKEVLVAKEALYRDGFWSIKSADIIQKPKDFGFDSKGIVVNSLSDVKILEGFRPKMLDQVYEGKVNFTILNAIDAIRLLSSENINTSSIKGALYKIFIYPLFVPCLIVIIFFFVPISVRFLNVSLFSFGAILATLLVWGVLFMFIELASNKTLSSELGIIAPVALLFLLALWQWRRFSHGDS